MEEELIDDQLEMDQSAYEMYHQAQTSILNFRIIILIIFKCLLFIYYYYRCSMFKL
jgi:hypothetical protein